MTLFVRRLEKDEIPSMVLRPLDEAECAAGGLTALDAIKLSIEGSQNSYALEYDSSVVCLWGDRPRSILGGVVSLWLLSSPLADQHRVAFGRETFRVCQGLLDTWSVIECLVWDGHWLAKRWLGWLGFKAAGAEWINGGKFLLMRRERD